MQQNQFYIPKQTDLMLVGALTAIRNDIKELRKLYLRLHPHVHGGLLDIQEDDPKESAAIKYVLDHNSEIIPSLYLFDSAAPNQVALSVERQQSKPLDLVTVHWDPWGNHLPADNRSQIFVRLMALAKKHLRSSEVQASFEGGGELEWSRYQNSQVAVLNSLEGTLKTIAVDYGRKIIEAEAAAKTKYDNLETQLRQEFEGIKTKQAADHEAKLKALDDREAKNQKREESFNTKEARYVARDQQQRQIEDIKKWLEGWSLTTGTRKKRWPVATAYIVALVVTLSLTIWFSFQNYEILKGKDFAQVSWWQWALMAFKAVLPFAAFTTFIIYFIKWSSAWARQHSEEEFRNRSRVLDIGRSAWLLEAVRDAHGNQKEIPSDLLKELSRNLFASSVAGDGGDLHPKSVNDFLLQGLSSIRVKSADGSEVEATRNKKPKD